MVQRLARSPFKPESDPSNTALSYRISDLQSVQEVTADARRCPSGAIWVQFAPKSKRLGTGPSPWLYMFVIRPHCYAFAAFAFLMPSLIARRCPCDFVFVHPPGTHTKTSTSLGLPRKSGKNFGTCFREQQRQVGQRRVPSTSMTPSSGSKIHVRRMGGSGISEVEISLIDTIFITLSLERTLSQFCPGHRGPASDHAESHTTSEALRIQYRAVSPRGALSWRNAYHQGRSFDLRKGTTSSGFAPGCTFCVMHAVPGAFRKRYFA